MFQVNSPPHSGSEFDALSNMNPDDAPMSVDDLSLDISTNDLSAWIEMDQENAHSSVAEDFPQNNLELDFDGNLLFEDFLDNCNQGSTMQDSCEETSFSSMDHSLLEEKSFAARPILMKNLTSQISSKSISTTNETHEPTSAPPAIPGASSLGRNELYYNIALDNLTSSMKRTELSRAQLLRYRQGLNWSASSPLPSSHNDSNQNKIADFLSGKRTALTAGVEYSRNQLRMYMMLINRNQPF